MKTLLILFMLILNTVAYAEDITLTQPEEVNPQMATLIDFRNVEINASSKIMIVTYIWKTATSAMVVGGRHDQKWVCKDVIDDLETIPDETDTCFTDVFLFNIRQVDVDTPLGKGLRNLIWNKMKLDILDPSNDGAFDD